MHKQSALRRWILGLFVSAAGTTFLPGGCNFVADSSGLDIQFDDGGFFVFDSDGVVANFPDD
jgi:hypothetical protein